MPIREAALWSEIVRLSKCSEEAIPPRDVSVIELMHIELVMDGVMLRTLQEVPHPTRSAQIAVVEVLAEDGKDVEPSASLR